MKFGLISCAFLLAYTIVNVLRYRNVDLSQMELGRTLLGNNATHHPILEPSEALLKGLRKLSPFRAPPPPLSPLNLFKPLKTPPSRSREPAHWVGVCPNCLWFQSQGWSCLQPESPCNRV